MKSFIVRKSYLTRNARNKTLALLGDSFHMAAFSAAVMLLSAEVLKFLFSWQLFRQSQVCTSPFFTWQAQDGKSSFEKEGGGVRGPRIVEHMQQSTCKYEKNWPICADDDWVSNELWGWKLGTHRRQPACSDGCHAGCTHLSLRSERGQLNLHIRASWHPGEKKERKQCSCYWRRKKGKEEQFSEVQNQSGIERWNKRRLFHKKWLLFSEFWYCCFWSW